MKRQLAVLATALAVISILAGCGAATPAVSDPKEIVAKSITTLQAMKTVHLRAEVSGSIQLPLGQSPGAFPLDGTTLEGDIDIAAKKLQFTVSIPPLMGMKIDLIGIDDAMYLKMSLLGDKWQKSTASTGSGAVSGVSDPQKALDEIKAFLDKPAVAPTKLADEKVGDKDCYHVQMNLPADELAGALGSPAPAASASVSSAVLDMWVEKDSMRLSKVALALEMTETGKLTITATMSKYDAAVTIVAPPADQVVEGGSGLFPGLGQ